jgi:transposase-like protein
MEVEEHSMKRHEPVYIDPPTEDGVRTDLRTLFLGAVRVALESALEEEIRAIVGGPRWAKLGSTRKDSRNGSYLRGLLTSFGHIDVAVPRSRNNGSACGVLGRYERRSKEVDDGIVAAYVHGVSTRNMSAVTEALMGEDVSRSTVSRVTERLEENVEALRNMPIDGATPYLYLDATFLDARWARAVENVSALVAYGVGLDGHRRLLAVTIGPEESEATWTDLLRQLLDRGLSGVQLVIADDHAGLKKAVRHMLPEARLQRCVVHFMRNVLAKTPHRLRARLGKELSAIFRSGSLKDARQRCDQLMAGLGKQVPESMEVLTNGFAAATQFFAFPKEHWHRLSSTNGLERLHGEVKRRIRSVGAFPDRKSALRLITTIALHATSTWASRRYLDMTLLTKEVKPELEKVA